MVTSANRDLEQPWLVRYQFYLFEGIEGKAASQQKLGCKPNLRSLKPAALRPEKVGRQREKEGGNF